MIRKPIGMEMKSRFQLMNAKVNLTATELTFLVERGSH